MIKSKLIIVVALFFSYPFNFIANIKSSYLTILKDNQEKITLKKSIADGKEVYVDFCTQCHLMNGRGDSKKIPPLDGSDWLTNKQVASIYAIKFGQSGEIIVNGKKFNNNMPTMGLSNQEIADVMNYIRNSWSNKLPQMISIEQVERVKQ